MLRASAPIYPEIFRSVGTSRFWNFGELRDLSRSVQSIRMVLLCYSV